MIIISLSLYIYIYKEKIQFLGVIMNLFLVVKLSSHVEKNDYLDVLVLLPVRTGFEKKSYFYYFKIKIIP